MEDAKNERIEKKEKKHLFKKPATKIVIFVFGAIVFLVLAVFFIKFFSSRESGLSKSLRNAINSTMKLDSFKITGKSISEMKFGDTKNQVITSSVLSNKNNFEKAMYEVNTVGEASNSPDSNFDVTVTFFNSDGKVFESAGGPIKESTVSTEEFLSNCKKIAFYNFKKPDLDQKNVNEQDDGVSVYKYTLNKLDSAIMDSHFEQYKSLLEDIRMDEIITTVAEVSYIVQNGMAISQELKIQTKVIRETGEYNFSYVSTIVYAETEANFDFSLPNSK